MNLYLDIPSPGADGSRQDWRAFTALQNHGLTNLHRVYWNLPTARCTKRRVPRRGARSPTSGPLVVDTGKHTARAAADKFIVREQSHRGRRLVGRVQPAVQPGEVQRAADPHAGLSCRAATCSCRTATPAPTRSYRLPIRIVTEKAWHSLFARNMFIEVRARRGDLKRHVPEFTVICAPSFNGSPIIDGTRTETFIIVEFRRAAGDHRRLRIRRRDQEDHLHGPEFPAAARGRAADALLGERGRRGRRGAIFFGLSGTGKTTLSADPSRQLIGDDEHGWSENGVFNFEDGCYAKVIRLSPEARSRRSTPARGGSARSSRTWSSIRFRGASISTTTASPRTPAPPIRCRLHRQLLAARSRPAIRKNVIFLTCDATGVMPPIARLTPEQAIYHFISGYTSKIAGTEIGLGVEPEITFSTCFGGPFMVHHPYVYAEMLKAQAAEARRHAAGW